MKVRMLTVLIMFLLAGFGQGCWDWFKPAASDGHMEQTPAPINLLMPKAVRIHPFTGTRTFEGTGGLKGLNVRIELLDGYGDSAKGFGNFRFELYRFLAYNNDCKGRKLATWDVPLMDSKANLTHWDNITRTYEFKLQWDKPIPVGRRLVVVAVFTSPFTQRLFAERVFVAGQ
ncbi:MAG: hypothetical protein SVT52_03985 [Planctomycetota bacterium]|nr:hypothetical protein [Planctomycetota bacterium]